jgi:hypothetical protein
LREACFPYCSRISHLLRRLLRHTLIDAPGIIHRTCEAVPPLLKLRHIANNPAMNGGVRHGNASLRHHWHEIPIAQPLGDVPADAQLDYLGIEAAPAINEISRYRLCHLGVSWTPELYDIAR